MQENSGHGVFYTLWEFRKSKDPPYSPYIIGPFVQGAPFIPRHTVAAMTSGLGRPPAFACHRAVDEKRNPPKPGSFGSFGLWGGRSQGSGLPWLGLSFCA